MPTEVAEVKSPVEEEKQIKDVEVEKSVEEKDKVKGEKKNEVAEEVKLVEQSEETKEESAHEEEEPVHQEKSEAVELAKQDSKEVVQIEVIVEEETKGKVRMKKQKKRK